MCIWSAILQYTVYNATALPQSNHIDSHRLVSERYERGQNSSSFRHETPGQLEAATMNVAFSSHPYHFWYSFKKLPLHPKYLYHSTFSVLHELFVLL